MSTAMGLNKMFILDKYFNELNKYWQSENLLPDKSKSHQSNVNQSQPCQAPALYNPSNESNQADVNDLIHLDAPITEDSLIRALHKRFLARECFTNIGPVLISINSLNDQNNALTLNSAHNNVNCYPLLRVVHEAVRQQNETGYPQAIILSGANGSGKTYSSMVILRQLFNVVGGGPETDAFKHLAAAFTVLRSLGSAKAAGNSESSRIGNFIEVQVTDGAIYRTKIHCYFLDHTRVVNCVQSERNFHIFYQMLAGLTSSEKTKLFLDGYCINDLNYLNCANMDYISPQDITRFEAWKSCLSVLGIPFMDVARTLAAILLLGNITFQSNYSQTSHKTEINAVASLLGVSHASLFKGLTTSTTCHKGQIVKTQRTTESSKCIRDSLAKALYLRTVATIIRRTNSSKRLASSCGTISSESNESIGNAIETASHNAPSSIGSACGKSYKTMAVLNNAVRCAMDGFIGILDMYGFEDAKPSRLEQLCINLCAETMQHFYNTHIFKSSIESCRDEGVWADIQIDYVDNVPCIDLISSLRTGLFSLLDNECQNRRSPESLVESIRSHHHSNQRYIEMSSRDTGIGERLNRCFGIKHFVSDVIYDTSHFLEANSDRLCDDIVAVFHKSSCSFGFVSHLFGAELRVLNNKAHGQARGIKFRVAPTVNLDAETLEPLTTFTQDFHTRLDNLLRTLVHARPHFVRCIKINNGEQNGYFDKASVIKQVRALQILETVNLMACGLPHRMRFKAFIQRYRLLVPSGLLKKEEDNIVDDCNLILKYFDDYRETLNYFSSASTSWKLGKKHIFLSESSRQQLEIIRNERRMRAARLIQTTWRAYIVRVKWPMLKQKLAYAKSSRIYGQFKENMAPFNEPSYSSGLAKQSRPQPIAGTPPPAIESSDAAIDCDSLDFNLVKQACHLLGIDLHNTPLVPPPRQYVVTQDNKMFFPQIRTFLLDFHDPVSKIRIPKGQEVLCLQASHENRGHVLVEFDSVSLDVPFHLFEPLLYRSPAVMNSLNI